MVGVWRDISSRVVVASGEGYLVGRLIPVDFFAEGFAQEPEGDHGDSVHDLGGDVEIDGAAVDRGGFLADGEFDLAPLPHGGDGLGLGVPVDAGSHALEDSSEGDEHSVADHGGSLSLEQHDSSVYGDLDGVAGRGFGGDREEEGRG